MTDLKVFNKPTTPSNKPNGISVHRGTDLLTRSEAAKALNVKPQTLASWATSKRYNLPYIKVGKKSVRYKRSDIDGFIKAGAISPLPSISNQQGIKKVDLPLVQAIPIPIQDPPLK